MAKPLSKNTIDNESNKFQNDVNDNVAVNVIGQQLEDIVDAINSSQNNNKTQATIYNVNLATANTEYSQVLSDNVKGFILRTRDKSDIKISFNSGESGTTYMTLKKGSVYTENDMNAIGLTIYFQSASSNITVEILEWV